MVRNKKGRVQYIHIFISPYMAASPGNDEYNQK